MYIGGASRGCSQPNLNASWVTGAVQQGWVLIPTYVGLQASCMTNTRTASTRLRPRYRAAAAADDAVAQMNALGLGIGNPSGSTWRPSATATPPAARRQTFLDAWSAQLRYRGYVPGVYGSAGSTIRSIVDKIGEPGYDLPDQLWIARWCTEPYQSSCYSGTRRPGGPGRRMGGPPADPAVPRRSPGDLGRRHHQRRQQHRRRRAVAEHPRRRRQLRRCHRAAGGLPDGGRRTDLHQLVGVGRTASPAGADAVADPVRLAPPPAGQRDLPHRRRDGSDLPRQQWRGVVRPVLGAVRRPAAHRHRRPGSTRQRGTGGVWNHLRSGKPSVRRTGPNTYGTAAGRRFTYAGGISSSAVQNYDVRWRRARWDGTFGDWTRPARWQKTTALGVTKGLAAAGPTACPCVPATAPASSRRGPAAVA